MNNTAQLTHLTDAEGLIKISPSFIPTTALMADGCYEHISLVNDHRYLPEINTPNYYDVSYKTPSGTIGTHFALEANSVLDAARRCPIMLSYGTPWHPNEFTVLAINPTPK